MAGDVYEPEEIYSNFNEEAKGTNDLQEMQRALDDGILELREVNSEIQSASSTLDAAWEGEAAEAARAGLNPIVQDADSAGQDAHQAKDLTRRQIESFDYGKANVVKPPDKPGEIDGLRDLVEASNPVTQATKAQAYNDAAQKNVEQMDLWTKASDYNGQMMPQGATKIEGDDAGFDTSPRSGPTGGGIPLDSGTHSAGSAPTVAGTASPVAGSTASPVGQADGSTSSAGTAVPPSTRRSGSSATPRGSAPAVSGSTSASSATPSGSTPSYSSYSPGGVAKPTSTTPSSSSTPSTPGGTRAASAGGASPSQVAKGSGFDPYRSGSSARPGAGSVGDGARGVAARLGGQVSSGVPRTPTGGVPGAGAKPGVGSPGSPGSGGGVPKGGGTGGAPGGGGGKPGLGSPGGGSGSGGGNSSPGGAGGKSGAAPVGRGGGVGGPMAGAPGARGRNGDDDKAHERKVDLDQDFGDGLERVTGDDGSVRTVDEKGETVPPDVIGEVPNPQAEHSEKASPADGAAEGEGEPKPSEEKTQFKPYTR